MSEQRVGQLHSVQRSKKTTDQRGAAMIVVVCVLMVVMILCLTIIVGAYQTVATVQDGRKDATYYRQAYSFSEALRDQIGFKEGQPAPEVSGSVTDLKAKIIAFAADEDLFGTAEDPVEEPSLVLTEKSRSADTGNGTFGKVVLTLKKRKVGINKAKLFVTTSVTEAHQSAGNPQDVLWEAACTAGYQVEVFQEGGKKKCKLTFRGYY